MRMYRSAELVLRLAGLGSISTITFQDVHERCQNETEKCAESVSSYYWQMYTQDSPDAINRVVGRFEARRVELAWHSCLRLVDSIRTSRKELCRRIRINRPIAS
jgi:hypothetical protein